MVDLTPALEQDTIEYPDSDGQPMADNTLQFEWITLIKGNLDWLFAEDPDVFVAGDLLWYPVQGKPKIRHAPDGLVAFGRPKGYRGSYQQWLEGDIPPQVVFEILSPGDRPGEMNRKLLFYQHYGVEEYYLYDPEGNRLQGWIRREEILEWIEDLQDWVSPRLGVRFDPSGEPLVIYRPDGEPFMSYGERSRQVERERARAERERARAERARARAERARADRFAAKLQALGLDPTDL
ncbi:Uma2 family endonuclease [Prochlorothrix hollandica]|uniref:Uma2 family endonuclease n=1 Tax=Prochlorothrix hollandica TaxID=1223 RepID=UPI00333FE8B7